MNINVFTSGGLYRFIHRSSLWVKLGSISIVLVLSKTLILPLAILTLLVFPNQAQLAVGRNGK